MRTTTPQMSAKLQQKLGTEPLLLLEVEWVAGSRILYSDQEISGATASIISLGGFDTSMMLSGSSDSQSVQVVLNDTDGAIKSIYNTHDIHKRPASIYLLFKGMNVADKMLLFKGELVTPIQWDASQRTLQFTILSKLNSVEVGFSMEEGDFANIPDEALGKAWPLVFGQVCHMPAVQVRAPRRGYLLRGEGIMDFTLDERICQALQIQCPAQQTGPIDTYQQAANDIWSKTVLGTIGPDSDCAIRRQNEICKLLDLKDQQSAYEHDTLNIYNGVNFPQAPTVARISIDQAIFTGTFSGNIFTVQSRKHPEFDTFNHRSCRTVPDMGYGTAAYNARLLADALRAIDISYPTAGWYGGQGSVGQYTPVYEVTAADIEAMKLAAEKRYGPQTADALKDINYRIAINAIDQKYPSPGWYGGEGRPGSYSAIYQVSQADIDALKAKVTSYWYPDVTGTYFINNASTDPAKALADCQRYLMPGRGPQGGPRDSWFWYDEMEEASFFWAPAGTEVFLESEAEIIFIASLISGTVDKVSAYKTAANGKRYLTEVPTDYYTVSIKDYDGYDVVEVATPDALSKIDEDWDDQIYVSFTSSVGPNPADIIKWLVEKYTDLTVDSTSYTSVKSLLTKYPSNFYILDRPDVYNLINDIAYQSRCSVYIRNNVLYMVYLSKEPTSVRTLTTADILNESLVESLSETEDVYTTHKIAWRGAGAPVSDDGDVERKVILKYNVKKYGTVLLEEDYYCLNIFELVLKTATFWLIRKSNSWKKLNFKLPIRHIDLDVNDCVTINVPDFGAAVKVVIENIQYNPNDNNLDVVCWTPIRSGETSQYYWAWPATQPAAGVWPLPGDTAGGAGYNFSVTPPVGHILTGGEKRYDQLELTTGDLHPSDIDDVTPSVTCAVSDYVDFNEKDPIIEAKEIAQAAARSSYSVSVSTGGGGASSGPNSSTGALKPIAEAGCGKGPGCNYKLYVTWHQSHAQGSNLNRGASWPDACGGPCPCAGGCPSCYGPIWSVCHTFGSPGGAKQFGAYMRRQFGTTEDGQSGYDGIWGCMESRVVGYWVRDGDLAAGCPKSADSEETSGGGETKQPVGLTGKEATKTGNGPTDLDESNVTTWSSPGAPPTTAEDYYREVHIQ